MDFDDNHRESLRNVKFMETKDAHVGLYATLSKDYALALHQWLSQQEASKKIGVPNAGPDPDTTRLPCPTAVQNGITLGVLPFPKGEQRGYLITTSRRMNTLMGLATKEKKATQTGECNKDATTSAAKSSSIRGPSQSTYPSTKLSTSRRL